jgi:uncharacterized membrane protein YgcG
MAYNAKILGGSPLGLIGVRSYYGKSGLSTFNAGKSRNVKVDDYNKNSSKAGMISGNSLFSGYRVVRAWPNVGAADTKGLSDVNYSDTKDKDGNIIKKGDNSTRRALHNNSVYDVSVLNIIEKLAGTKGALRPTDFAYLKNIGVYPNNRLMIARRFASPSDDNIMVPKGNSDLGSFATLISWIPENENFLDITFGEEWMDSEADFKTILTSLGEDIGLGNLGGMSGAAGNALPLPGFTEIFQRNFLSKLGLIDNDAKNSIPAGNPNLIKTSKRRKLVGYGDAGAGLKCTVNIKMVCEYELKYISGIDPTIVWMDLLGMITRFGTSNSETYGLSKGAAAKMISWVNDPNKLISDVAQAISDAIKGIIDEVKKAIEKVYTKALEVANKLPESDPVPPNPAEEPKPPAPRAEATALADKNKQDQNNMADELANTLGAIGVKALSGLLQKYRVKILGVVNSLSGLPSTPWHITIGNPMRPTFCSGDMLVENVSLSLGPNLTFNDLPSSMKVEFNLTNARPWGLQEIMAKFNSGYLRTVDVQKTFYETGKVSAPDGVTMYNEPVGILPLNDIVYESAASSSGTSGTSGSSGTSGAGGTNNTNPTNGAGGSTGTSGASGSTGTSGTSGASGSNKAPAPTNPANVEKAVKGKKENKKEMNKNASDPALKK